MSRRAKLTPAALERVERLLDGAVGEQRDAAGGHSAATCVTVTLGDGRRAFVKAAADETTAAWLRAEAAAYTRLTGAPFLPRLLGWDDDCWPPLLVVEALTGADSCPPWTPERIASVRAMLLELAAAPPPPAPTLEQLARGVAGWRAVARAPTSLLGLGLCSESWLQGALPTLAAAASAAPLAGDALVHGDVRGDNLRFVEGRPLLFDWTWSCRGNSRFDLVCWLPSLHCEGGPAPWEIIDGEAELVAWLAGYWGAKAGRPGPPAYRAIQREQLAVALPWAARALSLPPGLGGGPVTGAAVR